MLQNVAMTACTTEGLFEYLQSLIVDRHIPKFFGMPLYQICYQNILAKNLVNNRGLQLLGLEGWPSLAPLFAAEIVLVIIFLYVQANGNTKKEEH